MIDGGLQKPKKSQREASRKKWVLIGIIVVVLFGAGTAGAWFYMTRKQSEGVQADGAAAKKINKTIDDADKLAGNKKTGEAMATYDKAIQNTSDTTDKLYLYMNKATLAFNEKNYDEALVITKEADAVGPSFGITYLMAQIYEKKGDLQNAIKYYEKTITLVDKNSPTADDEIQGYKSKVAVLKEKQ